MQSSVQRYIWTICCCLNLVIAPTSPEPQIPLSFTCAPGTSEVMIDSDADGVFHSPGWPDGFEPDSRCLFRFVAPPGRKILIEFTYFSIGGLYPYCESDFLDVYVDLASSHPRNEEEARFLAYLQEAQGQRTTTPFSALLFSSMLARSRLLGRFCGVQSDGRSSRHIPQRFVSIYREVILDFFAAPSPRRPGGSSERLGFNGTFKIIPDDLYYPGKVASKRDIPSLPRAFLGGSGKVKTTTPSTTTEPSCWFVIEPKADTGSHQGELVSPAYPGFHPTGLQCIYVFRGKPNQRVRILVKDLKLPSQIHSCSTDFVQFFDESNSIQAPSIGERICGEHRDLVIYSTETTMTMVFVTNSAVNDDTFRDYRGFHITYEFSDKFVPVENNLKDTHIRGTECDFAMRSGSINSLEEVKKEPSRLPSFHYSMTLAPSHSCTFFFLGRHERQRFETVRVAFDLLDLPPFNPESKQCTGGYMAVYGARIANDASFRLHPVHSASDSDQLFTTLRSINGLSDTSAVQKLPRPSQTWCGDQLAAIKTKDDPDSSAIHSMRSNLAIRFSAGAATPMTVRFRAFYKFVSDYRIAGQMVVPNQCSFVYRGRDYQNGQVGWTNSPFFANTYPANANCLYLFRPDPGQSLRLSFTTFQTAEEPPLSEVGNNQFYQDVDDCKQDSLDVIELLTEVADDSLLLEQFAMSNQKGPKQLSFGEFSVSRVEGFRKTHSFCGDHIPGPVIPSPDAKALLLSFHSDETGTAAGFQMKFQFLPQTTIFPKSNDLCFSEGTNMTEFGGLLQSPGYPYSYPKSVNCKWELKVNQPAQGIMMQFSELSVEGTFKECRNAVIRINLGESTRSIVSICGFASVIPAYVTNHTSISISMITTDDAYCAKGFKLIWTKILPRVGKGKCHGFSCAHSGHCIPKEVQCNSVPNCGTYTRNGHILTDDSDEITNCEGAISYSYIHIGMGILLTLITLTCLAVYIVYREYQRKRKNAQDPLDIPMGEDEDDFGLYSPQRSYKDIPPPPPSQMSPPPVKYLPHTCKHTFAPLQNGAIGLHIHHSETASPPQGCITDPPVRNHIGNHSVRSEHTPTSPAVSVDSGEESRCPTCPCGHSLVISSPALPVQPQLMAAHCHSHASSRRPSYASQTKERMQKISIV